MQRSRDKKSCRVNCTALAYKLYPPEGQLGNHFMLQLSFLGPGVIPIHLVFLQLGKRTTFQPWLKLRDGVGGWPHGSCSRFRIERSGYES